jgi:hypothetical protein
VARCDLRRPITAEWSWSPNGESLSDGERSDLGAFTCADCRIDTRLAGDFYLVHDAVWAAAGIASDGGVLCLAWSGDWVGR